MNALVVHTDATTVAMAAGIALTGLLLGVGLIGTIRHRSAPTHLPAIALRHTGTSRLSSARTHVATSDDDHERENAS